MLSYTTDDHGLRLSVAYDRYDGDRYTYNYRIEQAEGDVWVLIAEGADLRSGSCGPYDRPTPLSEMLCTLATFFSAYGESLPEGENADMFPLACSEAAVAYRDELACIGEDIGVAD